MSKSKGLISGTSVVKVDEGRQLVSKGQEAFIKLAELRARPSGNFLKDFNIYRKYVPDLLDSWMFLREGFLGLKNVEANPNAKLERANRRWTDEEDKALIDLVTGGSSLVSVSQHLRRTPLSISSRLSHLVGVKRISQKVAGRLFGEIEGLKAEGLHIEGDLLYD